MPDPEPDTGRGMCARLPPGSYRILAPGIVDDTTVTHDAALACNLKYDSASDRGGENLWGGDADECQLDPVYALAGLMGKEPRSLDEAL